MDIFWFVSALHPGFKLRYFKKAGWEKEWITTTEKIVHEEFKRVYADFKLQSNTFRLAKLRKSTTVCWCTLLYSTHPDFYHNSEHRHCLTVTMMLRCHFQTITAVKRKKCWVSLIVTCLQRPWRVSRTHWHGGMRTEAHTLASGGWPVIFWLFQVIFRVLVIQHCSFFDVRFSNHISFSWTSLQPRPSHHFSYPESSFGPVFACSHVPWSLDQAKVSQELWINSGLQASRCRWRQWNDCRWLPDCLATSNYFCFNEIILSCIIPEICQVTRG